MSYDLLLLAWVAALICTAVFAIRRRWKQAQWFGAASVIISIGIVILKPK